MTADFDIVFTVVFRHRYFSNLRLDHLTVTPGKESVQTFVNNGLLFKPFKDGFHVLYDTSQAGRKRERAELLDQGITLRFILSLTDSHFYNYTSVVTDSIKDHVFYFRNTTSGANSEGNLHEEEFVSEKDLLSLEALGTDFFVKPFGIIDIELRPSLPRENKILFDKKTSYWQYIVIGDHFSELSNLAIVNVNSEAVFEGPEKIKLPDKREALLFTSLNPIDTAEKPADLFQLVENYETGSRKHKVVKRALPVPDIKTISSGSGKIPADKKTMYSEIFIY